MMNTKIKLAIHIATNYFLQKKESMDEFPTIDIGCSVGNKDMCGMMGPNSMLRPTSIGVTGGVAARLENAAKKMASHKILFLIHM